MNEPEVIEIEVAGHTKPRLRVYTGVSMCGEIKDGITLSHAGLTKFSSEGGWVVSFADLEKVYLAARAFRAAISAPVGAQGAE